jgi:hypothetical protein
MVARADGLRATEPRRSPPLESKPMAQARIAALWCRFMHTEPMWPSHGQYQCRTCGQRHRVCWEQASPVVSRVVLLPRETRAHSGFVTTTESRIQCP